MHNVYDSGAYNERCHMALEHIIMSVVTCKNLCAGLGTRLDNINFHKINIVMYIVHVYRCKSKERLYRIFMKITKLKRNLQ